jgi:hypothetical protein
MQNTQVKKPTELSTIFNILRGNCLKGVIMFLLTGSHNQFGRFESKSAPELLGSSGQRTLSG